MRLAIGGRLFSQAGSPRGSSEETIRLVVIPCELSKLPVGAAGEYFAGQEGPAGRRKEWLGIWGASERVKFDEGYWEKLIRLLNAA
jgi:hypothetical protein